MIYIFSSIFLYLFCLLFLYFFQRKILFNTSDKPYKPEYYGLTSVKQVYPETTDKVSLWSKSSIKYWLVKRFCGNNLERIE